METSNTTIIVILAVCSFILLLAIWLMRSGFFNDLGKYRPPEEEEGVIE